MQSFLIYQYHPIENTLHHLSFMPFECLIHHCLTASFLLKTRDVTQCLRNMSLFKEKLTPHTGVGGGGEWGLWAGLA